MENIIIKGIISILTIGGGFIATILSIIAIQFLVYQLSGHRINPIMMAMNKLAKIMK